MSIHFMESNNVCLRIAHAILLLALAFSRNIMKGETIFRNLLFLDENNSCGNHPANADRDNN
jgi:hypothetical protein